MPALAPVTSATFPFASMCEFPSRVCGTAPIIAESLERGEHLANRRHDLVELLLLDDERGGDGEDVAGRTHQHVLLVTGQVRREAARARRARARGKLDPAHE